MCLKMDNASKNPKETVSTAEICRSWHGRHEMVKSQVSASWIDTWHLTNQPTIEGFNNKCTIKFPCPFLHIPELILHGRAIATIMWVAPSNDRSICQDSSKCSTCGMNLLHFPELILHGRAVTTIFWSPPSNNASICQDCSKCERCGKNLLHIPELILHGRAIAAQIWISPSNDRSICQDSNKC